MEMASTHARIMIETLLSVHALANMLRASGDDEYRKTAAGWLPGLEWQLACLKRELAPRTETAQKQPSPSDSNVNETGADAG